MGRSTNLPPYPAYKPSTSLFARVVTGKLDVRTAADRTGTEPS
ncbi:MAG: hypothetical protein OXI80_03610 [Caldilineaceae bacterium]|nr:hypothetical protein [Caldilineaceae bacterium]MDE0336734.1 hypothetical protein [Caldilineaceae bacterium]